LLQRATEMGWLTAIVAVPLTIVHPDWMFGSVETPKVFVLRSVALLMAILVTLEWATARDKVRVVSGPATTWLSRFGFISHPARFVFVGAAGVLIANVLSVVFSPVWAVSIGGIDAGTDAYGLFSVASYVVIFWVTATHLKSDVQVRRLLWAVVIAGVAMSVVGIGQRFGLDPLSNNPLRIRVPLTAGNPIFAGALLSMTLPLTMAAVMSLRERVTPYAHIGIGAGLLGIQLIALALTLGRGSWVATATGLIVFLGTVGWMLGAETLRRPAMMLAVLAALALVVGLANPGMGSNAVSRFTAVLSSISNGEGIGPSGRVNIWSAASDAYFDGPWVDTTRIAEIPDIAPRSVRPLVGYGPNMYPYANFAAGGPMFTEHGHNFLVHTAVELGSLGIAAYVGLLAATGALLLRMLRRNRARNTPLLQTYAVGGLTAVLAGRLIEQLVGKAQIADLTLSWVLAGAVAALAAMDVESGSAMASPNWHGLVEHPARSVAASLLIVALMVVWWQSVLLTASSSIAGAGALQSGILGLREETIAGYENAISRSPTVAVNHLALADVLRTLSTVEQDAPGRLGLLREADEHLQMVVDRNPLDYRARRIQADVKRLMASQDPAVMSNALKATRTLEALQPEYWGPVIQLARLLLLANDYEAALAAVNRAEQLRPVGGRRTARELGEQLRELQLKLSPYGFTGTVLTEPDK
jgi:O-antigen ligase